jgi:hypothetical protein
MDYRTAATMSEATRELCREVFLKRNVPAGEMPGRDGFLVANIPDSVPSRCNRRYISRYKKYRRKFLELLTLQWALRESNPRPSPCKRIKKVQAGSAGSPVRENDRQ